MLGRPDALYTRLVFLAVFAVAALAAGCSSPVANSPETTALSTDSAGSAEATKNPEESGSISPEDPSSFDNAGLPTQGNVEFAQTTQGEQWAKNIKGLLPNMTAEEALCAVAMYTSEMTTEEAVELWNTNHDQLRRSVNREQIEQTWEVCLPGERATEAFSLERTPSDIEEGVIPAKGCTYVTTDAVSRLIDQPVESETVNRDGRAVCFYSTSGTSEPIVIIMEVAGYPGLDVPENRDAWIEAMQQPGVELIDYDPMTYVYKGQRTLYTSYLPSGVMINTSAAHLPVDVLKSLHQLYVDGYPN